MVLALVLRGQWTVVQALHAVPLIVRLAEDEWRKDQSDREREAVFELMLSLEQDQDGREMAIFAVCRAFFIAKDTIELSDIIGILRAARGPEGCSGRVLMAG